MSELPTGIPRAEVQGRPDADPAVKNGWVAGFIQGNEKWPQANEGISVFTTLAILKNPPSDWVALSRSKLSAEQLSKVGAAASAHHRNVGVNLATEEHAQPGDQILALDKLTGVWDDVVQHNVIGTISNYVDTFGGPAQEGFRTTEQKTKEIQVFFDDRANAPHIAALTRTLAVARDALLTPDSVNLSNFYKFSLTGSKEYWDSLEQYKTRYSETFNNNWMSFYDNPGKGAWDLAANNVKKALSTELSGQDVSWLELNLGLPD